MRLKHLDLTILPGFGGLDALRRRKRLPRQLIPTVDAPILRHTRLRLLPRLLAALHSRQISSNLSQYLLNCGLLLLLRKPLYRRMRQLPQPAPVVALPEHLLVVLEHVVGQALEDPGVLEGFQGGHALDGVPDEALIQKIKEIRIIAPEQILKSF